MLDGCPTILTVDPGFAELGYGVVQVRQGRDVLVELGVIVTRPTKHKGPLKTEDSFRRLREQSERLWKLAGQYGIDAICFESLSIPQQTSKQSAIKIGHPYGEIAMLAAALDVPVCMVTPQAVKQAACGAQNASKADVEAAMAAQWGSSNVAFRFVRDVAAGLHNHGWDALAAYHAAGRHDVMKAIKRGGRGLWEAKDGRPKDAEPIAREDGDVEPLRAEGRVRRGRRIV